MSFFFLFDFVDAKGISSLLLGSMAVVDALCQLGAGKAAEVGGLAPLFLKRAQGCNRKRLHRLCLLKLVKRRSIACSTH